MSEVALTASAISALGNILIAGAAVAAAVAAFMGLDTWKKQHVWQRDHDLARRILVGIYVLKDAAHDVRNPFMTNGERAPDNDDDPEKAASHSDGTVRAYSRRWSRVQEADREVRALMREADAIWGRSLSDLYKDLHKLNHELYVVIFLYLDSIREDDPESRKEFREILKKKRFGIYANDSDDVFVSEYKRVLAPIESYLTTKLGRKTA